MFGYEISETRKSFDTVKKSIQKTNNITNTLIKNGSMNDLNREQLIDCVERYVENNNMLLEYCEQIVKTIEAIGGYIKEKSQE